MCDKDNFVAFIGYLSLPMKNLISEFVAYGTDISFPSLKADSVTKQQLQQADKLKRLKNLWSF